jgi:enamine deaminase RidA (YjgF/YER057c/UK114 family)
MTKKIINPWTYENKFGSEQANRIANCFVQANKITNVQHMLFCAGIVSIDENGDLLHAGDMKKQINQIFDNIETILRHADLQLSDIVKLTYYTTDMLAFSEAVEVLMDRLEKGGCRPATTTLGVASLFHPDCLVEIEATVVK